MFLRVAVMLAVARVDSHGTRGACARRGREPVGLSAGEIRIAGTKMLVGCGGETLLGVSRVKLQGRKDVSAVEFANGAHLQPGEHFD